MDQVILAQKLESLRRCIRRVEERTPTRVELLEQDPDIQDILVLNLTRAVQLCVDIGSHVIGDTEEPAPATMGDVFTTLERLNVIGPSTREALRKAVGFRNVAVHNYDAINWDIVFAISRNFLEDFREFARQVVENSGTR